MFFNSGRSKFGIETIFILRNNYVSKLKFFLPGESNDATKMMIMKIETIELNVKMLVRREDFESNRKNFCKKRLLINISLYLLFGV